MNSVAHHQLLSSSSETDTDVAVNNTSSSSVSSPIAVCIFYMKYVIKPCLHFCSFPIIFCFSLICNVITATVSLVA